MKQTKTNKPPTEKMVSGICFKLKLETRWHKYTNTLVLRLSERE